jgi:hypothetical protein
MKIARKDSGISENKYLKPYEEAVEFQIATIKKFWAKQINNKPLLIKDSKSLFVKNVQMTKVVPIKIIGENQNKPNS